MKMIDRIKKQLRIIYYTFRYDISDAIISWNEGRKINKIPMKKFPDDFKLIATVYDDEIEVDPLWKD